MGIAATIYSQIGGNKMAVMCGLINIVGGEDFLQFSFKGCRKANKCKIILNGLDLYNIEFYKFNNRSFECPIIKSIQNVYNDQLIKVFENFTGLLTSLS